MAAMMNMNANCAKDYRMTDERGQRIEQEPIARRTHIEEAMDMLEMSRARLEDSVVTLLSRLSSVTRDDHAKPSQEVASVSQQFVPLAEAIRRQSYALDYLHEHVCSVIDRIELPYGRAGERIS